MQNDQVIIDKDVFISLRGDPALHPDASFVIFVNAKSDLTKVQYALNHIAGYKGNIGSRSIMPINF